MGYQPHHHLDPVLEAALDNEAARLAAIEDPVLAVQAVTEFFHGLEQALERVAEPRHLAIIERRHCRLGLYGFVAPLQPDANFGRILAAYGGVFVAGSLAWGMVADGFRPDRYDIAGALVCLIGFAVIMYAPRTTV